MKIAIDSSPLESGHSHRGVGGYTRNLINALTKISGDIHPINFQTHNNDLKHFNLLHYTYFDLFFRTLPNHYLKKSIVTVHDVIPLLYPKHYPPGIKGKINFLIQKHNLQKAARIITVSETSKKDIVRFLKIDPNKIDVIYEAPVVRKSQVKVDTKLKLPNQFVLYIGDVNYNKNLITLAKACEKAKTPLVIVGKSAATNDFDKNHVENKSLLELLEKYGNSKNVIRLGYLTDTELNEVWSKATIYCQPSFYEGFGLPVLEAMQEGVPVIASKTQALVETAGGAAIFADPKNVNSFAEKIEKLLSNKKLRVELIKKGKAHIKKFSWEKAAYETLETCKKALRNV